MPILSFFTTKTIHGVEKFTNLSFPFTVTIHLLRMWPKIYQHRIEPSNQTKAASKMLQYWDSASASHPQAKVPITFSILHHNMPHIYYFRKTKQNIEKYIDIPVYINNSHWTQIIIFTTRPHLTLQNHALSRPLTQCHVLTPPDRLFAVVLSPSMWEDLGCVWQVSASLYSATDWLCHRRWLLGFIKRYREY